MKRLRRLLPLLLLACASALHAGSQVVASQAALSTASPLATRAGLTVLRNGGTAADAAVAVAFTLAVVHPQAGNLGGGGICLYYDAKTEGVWTLDFTGVAPLAASRDMFVQPDGNVSDRSRTGPLAAVVPGSVAGLAELHARFGSLPWKSLVAPTAALAAAGVTVGAALSNDLVREQNERGIQQFAPTAALFFSDGKPLATGARLVQRDLAATLERIAQHGASDFYRGETAKRLVAGARAAGGVLSLRDLREYKAVWRAPILLRYREYEIYTAPPPSSGGIVLGAALNIVTGYDFAAFGFQSPRALHVFAEAARRAAIDRANYLADPATARIPYKELLSKERAEQWRRSINPDRVTATVTLADPAAIVADGTHTTHFTIVDAEGNVAAVTTTLNDDFGSGFVVPGLGFFLNGAMDNFTAAPGKPDGFGFVAGRANAIDAGKRPVSSLTPTIVLKGGAPFLAFGTGGGPSIPTTLLQVFLNVAVYGKPLYEAIAAHRYHHQGVPDQIEYERAAPQATIDGVNAFGHAVLQRDAIGDVHAVLMEKGRVIAVADPRRGGAAGGY